MAFVVLFAARSSPAYDGSGGARTAALLSRVDFTTCGNHESDPPHYEWTESKRREVAGALSRILTQMPLDLADLPEIERLSISNARCAAPADPESLDTATFYPEDNSVAVSGSLYTLSLGTSTQARTILARVLQHELTHAWERKSDAKSFFALGFEKRDEEWFRVLARCERSDEKAEERAEKAGEMFLALGFPARFGGSTGRVDPTASTGEKRVDTYSMTTRHEYLAVLSELLWVDPFLALSQYSPEEVDWVERHVFMGRPVVAFDAAAQERAK